MAQLTDFEDVTITRQYKNTDYDVVYTPLSFTEKTKEKNLKTALKGLGVDDADLDDVISSLRSQDILKDDV